jgi:hypothetical protein
VTWQSDHHMADEPMIDETLPDEPLPAEPLPAKAMMDEPMTDEPMTDEPMTGARAMESGDPDLVIVESATEFSNGTDISSGTDASSGSDISDGTAGDNGTAATRPAASAGLSEQWHDIQAMFVDDPRGSVERAAQEAEAAVSALVESLRQRQAALVPAGSSTDPSDTEQLRAALRAYRLFCQRLVGLKEQLPPTGAMAL